MADPLDELLNKYQAKPAQPEIDPLDQLVNKYAKPKPSAWELFANTPIVKGLKNIPVSAMQAASRMGILPAGTNEGVQMAADQMARSNASKTAELYGEGALAKVSEGFAQSAPLAVIPGGGSLLARLGIGALTGAAGGAMSPAETKQEQQNFWGTKTQQVVGGGAGGALSAGVGYGLEKGTRKAASALAGTKLGNRLGIKSELNPKYQGAPELSRELDAAGIEHTVGDITSDPAVLSYEAAMGRRDPRMMDLRVRQNQQATKYANQMVNELELAAKSEGWRGIDDLQAAVQAGGKRANEAQKLITVLESVGDDTKQAVKASGNLELLTRKLRADAKYDAAEAIAAEYGAVKPTKLTDTLKRNIEAIESNKANDQAVVPYLRGILEDVEAGRNLDFKALRETRTVLNRRISGLTNPQAAVQDVDAARTALGNVVSALESDMDTFATQSGGPLRQAWKEASDYYKGAVVPFKEKGIAKYLTAEDPKGLMDMFKGKNPYEQKRMYDLLEPKGKAALRAAIIGDAVDYGEKTQRVAMAPTMSAAKVAAALERLDKNGTLGVIAPKGESMQIKGMARLLRAIDRSDTIAWIPQTGEVAERLGSQAAQGQTTAIGVGEKIYHHLNKERLFKLYTDPKGKALLVHASTLREDSPAWKHIMNTQLPRILASYDTSSAERVEE